MVPLPAPLRADQGEDLLLPGVGVQAVAEPLLERVDALGVVGPELEPDLARPSVTGRAPRNVSQFTGSGASSAKS